MIDLSAEITGGIALTFSAYYGQYHDPYDDKDQKSNLFSITFSLLSLSSQKLNLI